MQSSLLTQRTASVQNLLSVPILADIELCHCRTSRDREVRTAHFQAIFAQKCSSVLLGLDTSKTTETQLVKEKEVPTSKPGALVGETGFTLSSVLQLHRCSCSPQRRTPGATLTRDFSLLKVHVQGESSSVPLTRAMAVLP